MKTDFIPLEYVQIDEHSSGRMITIAEYISWKQPEIAAMLRSVKQVFAFSLPFETWKVIMEEPPLPGRAGVLPGEMDKLQYTKLFLAKRVMELKY